VKLADTLALGANGEIRGGSTPLPPTIDIIIIENFAPHPHFGFLVRQSGGSGRIF
jgi:hypothetical protein